MDYILDKLKLLKIVPVVRLDRVDDVKPLGRALCRGGLPIAEITFRTDAAEGAIREMKREFPDMCIGAGTVVNVEQAKRALDAGAEFLVSPGFSAKVTEFALAHNIMIFPGISTPSEIMTAMDYGLKVVKFFPAEQNGGLHTIRALAAPFPEMQFMPTGGIHAGNVKEFLSFEKVIACGGSWMVKPSFIENGEFDNIMRLTRNAVELVK